MDDDVQVPIRGISHRTYMYGSKARQILDTISILCQNKSKSEIVNFAVFHLAHDIMTLQQENPGMTAPTAYMIIRQPLEEVRYEELLLSISPTLKDQTPLDMYLGMSLDVEGPEERPEGTDGGDGDDDL